VHEAARRFGALEAHTDWRHMLDDRRIQILINASPNYLHAEASIAAAERGIHVLCEKPLARSVEEADQMLAAARRAGIVHMTGYNYRFIPAVQLARRFIAEGRLGQIYHFRARYSDDSMVDPSTPYSWRHSRARAGSGVIGDLASHAIDLARFLVGDIVAVAAATRVFVPLRPSSSGSAGIVDVEDALEAVVEFANGAVGTLEASTFCPGRKNFLTFEINGALGSLEFNLERLNELRVFVPDKDASGFRTVLVTESYHPYGGVWWPPGHVLGWEHTFVHQFQRFLVAVAEGTGVEPDGASFEDGYQCVVVCEMLERAAREGRRQVLGSG
jgi:predicted dehydrogenase